MSNEGERQRQLDRDMMTVAKWIGTTFSMFNSAGMEYAIILWSDGRAQSAKILASAGVVSAWPDLRAAVEKSMDDKPMRFDPDAATS